MNSFALTAQYSLQRPQVCNSLENLKFGSGNDALKNKYCKLQLM